MLRHPVRRLAVVVMLMAVLLVTLLPGSQTSAAQEGPQGIASLAGVPQITYTRFERTSLDYLYAAYCTNVADSYALDWGQINPNGSTAWSSHQDNPALNGCLQGVLFFSGVGDGEHLFITITSHGGGATTVSRFDLYPTPTHMLNQCAVQTDGFSPLIRDPRYRWDTAAGISCAFVDPVAVGVTPTPVPPTPVPPTPVPPTPVPPVDQLNVPYVDQVYVQQQPEYGYWNHCGPASVAMVLAATGKETRDVFTVRQATLDLVPQVKPTGTGGSDWWLMLNVLGSRGLAVNNFAPNFDTIRASILAGKPVIAAINPPDHFIVITGAAADGTVTINDPFGGKFWWKSADYSLRNDNARNRNAPASKGKGVTYVYSDLALVLTASVGSNAPVPAPVVLMVAASGGTLNNQRVQLTFPGPTTAQIQAADSISVTLTPQFSPANPVTTRAIALDAFRLLGVDATGQTVTQYPRDFTVTVDLNQDLIKHWGTVGGVTSDSGAGNATGKQTVQDLAKALTLAAWDPAQGSWVVLSTSVDLANYRLSAQTNRFTDFAVLVQQPSMVYIPFLAR